MNNECKYCNITNADKDGFVKQCNLDDKFHPICFGKCDQYVVEERDSDSNEKNNKNN